MAETMAQAGAGLASVEDFMRRWEAAWTSHDADAVLALMTEDVVVDDSSWPVTMRGHEDMRAYLTTTWGAMPDLAVRMTEGPFVDAGGTKAAFYWEGSGTFTGPLDPPGLAPTGQRLTFHGFDLHEYRDGRVARLRVVFDMLAVSQQLGLSPKPGSRAEKATVAAQRLFVRLRERLRRR